LSFRRLFNIAPGDFVEPLDFSARLAALVANPRVNLTRNHGVFAPHHRLFEQVTPTRRARRHAAMTWAQRLKREFKIEVETCEPVGGKRKIMATIEDPAVIKRILAHLANRQGTALTGADRPGRVGCRLTQRQGRWA